MYPLSIISVPRENPGDEALPMTSSLHYQPVDGERLEFEPEIYGNDDTAQIFGDDSRLPIGLRELLVDPRLSPSKRVFCCGAAGTLIAFFCVILLFIIGGYVHVQNDITERAYQAHNGLEMVPKVLVEGTPIMFLNSPENALRYSDEIKNYIDKYEKEQSSRAKYTTDCGMGKKPEHSWCRFSTTTSFIRAGKKGCTAEDKYGYLTKEPCVLLLFKDTINWEPSFRNGSNTTQLPFKCHIVNTFVYYDFLVNVSYYPVNHLNADYGGFPLNKIPSRSINTTNNEEVVEEMGDTITDLPGLAFVKFSLPPHFQHGSVLCKIVDTLPQATFTNLESFRAVRELRFDIVA